MNRKEDYLKLAVYLQNCGYDEITLTFDQVEEIIEKTLPTSAYRYNEWWSNNEKQHSHCVWLQVNYKTSHVNLTQKTVMFRRK